MTHPSALINLVEAARRRTFVHHVVEQALTGTCAALGGAALILIAGSDLLDWRWLILLFAGGVGWSAWRTLKRIKGPYEVVQEIDRRMDLSDTLSTAYYFNSEDKRGLVAPELWQVQRARAEEASQSLSPSDVFPWALPRQAYIAGLMIAMMGGLFMVRYGLLGTLDVRAPMVQGLSQFFQPSNARNAKGGPGDQKQGEKPLGIAVDDQGPEQKDLDAASPDALSEVNTPDVNAGVDTKDILKSQVKEIKAQAEEGDAMDDSGEGDQRTKGGDGKDGNSQASDSATPDGQKGIPQEAKNGEQGKEGNNSSLMDKMRDAMANLLAKMKMPNQGQPKQGSNPKGAQGGGEMQGKQGGQQKGQTQGKGSPTDDSEGADEGQPSEEAQSGQGKGADKGSEQSQAAQQSGMGKQDGEKSIKDAEQAAAMGKISEIFGKRAQNVTGEMMVEVKSSKQQQLRTAYADRANTHREAGSEIHRDEVPLDLQYFVQQYFEKVRKPSAGSKPEAAIEEKR